MKKFSFSLDSVLGYKNQVLDNLRNEHGRIIAQVSEQEKVVNSLKKKYEDLNNELNEKNLQGMTVSLASSYKYYLKIVDNEIKEAIAKLSILKSMEEEKQKEVIEAKKEKASIDKLKEKKMEVYKAEVQKSEELFIEEFVSYARFTG